jgi:hypothetical protein
MFSFKRWLLCAALAFSSQLLATPPLTTIEDVLYNADGTRFNGVVTISWQSFVASDASNVAANTESISITNGNLYVQLTPTTNAETSALYTVQFTSNRATQYSETWTVPPSILPLRVGDVLVPPGAVTGTGPAAVTSIQIANVNGLQTALNARVAAGPGFAVSRAAVINASGSMDGAVGNLSDCVHVDGTSGQCGGSETTPVFADGETPGGVINGSNATFTLANAPNPASSLALFRNGLLLEQGLDYALSGSSISFQSADIPQPGDIVQASYRVSVSLPGVGFVDEETPAGTIDGVNASFTLSQTPSPATSLAVYLNGLRLSAGVDYTATGSSISFGAGIQPQPGDILLCSYRTAQ